MQDLSNKSLMMIEPEIGQFNPNAIEDELTEIARKVFSACTFDLAFKGVHRSPDGAHSDNKRWKTLMGRETNSLLAHYVAHYRSALPPGEVFKLGEEWGFMNRKG